MNAELHTLILIYTIHDDGVRNNFLEQIKTYFPQCTQIDESTYALTGKDVESTANAIKSIYNKSNDNQLSQGDYISLLYAAFLHNQTYKSNVERDCIVENHIIGANGN